MALTAPCFNFDHPTLGDTAKALNPVWTAWEMLADPPADATPEYMARWRNALADALEGAAAKVASDAGHSCQRLGLHRAEPNGCKCPCLDCTAFRESRTK